ncbi:IMP cyclohydrolase [Methanopyrus sp.]
MYVGRFLLAGKLEDGTPVAVYGICSRSFQDRRIEVHGDAAFVVPEDPNYITENPYVAYTCARVVDEFLVLTNGAQTDPIADKLESGVPPREALVSVTFAMDYEHDEYNTPRISLVTDGETFWLGRAAPEEVCFRAMEPKDGEGYLLSVYGKYAEVPSKPNVILDREDPLKCDPVPSFEHYVCSVVARRDGDRWSLETG